MLHSAILNNPPTISTMLNQLHSDNKQDVIAGISTAVRLYDHLKPLVKTNAIRTLTDLPSYKHLNCFHSGSTAYIPSLQGGELRLHSEHSGDIVMSKEKDKPGLFTLVETMPKVKKGYKGDTQILSLLFKTSGKLTAYCVAQYDKPLDPRKPPCLKLYTKDDYFHWEAEELQGCKELLGPAPWLNEYGFNVAIQPMALFHSQPTLKADKTRYF